MTNRGRTISKPSEPSRNQGRLGYTTIVGVFLIAALSAIFSVALEQAQLSILKMKAQVAADLAALSGALEIRLDDQTACRIAAQYARKNDAELANCFIDHENITIVTKVTENFLRIKIPVIARAKAGPERVN